MTASFRKIDYSLRPAKHAERRMLAEIFRRLGPFDALENYTYVGFGSVWFSDFILFHKSLGIRDMISIEKNTGIRDRVDFNKPFRMDVMFEEASTAIPKLDWSRKIIAWLDYDSVVSSSVLSDVRSIADRARSGTVLSVSLQCNEALELDEARKEPDGASATHRFRTRFSRSRVPEKLGLSELVGWPFAALSRSMVLHEIEDALATRNGLGEKVGFRILGEIEYADDAKMTTLSGIFFTESDEERLRQCAFEKIDFLPAHAGPVRIVMPKITTRELRHLERQLPRLVDDQLDLGPIPPAEAKNFMNMYRYFPNFSVLES